jgi:predicted PurR-regulated permease PerM
MTSSDRANFIVFVLAVILVVVTGWLLVIGQSLLLPIFAAVISVYVLVTAADALAWLPLVGRLPLTARRLLVLVLFTLAVIALGLVVAVTVDQLVDLIPVYRANLETVTTRIADMIGVEATWVDVRDAYLGKINMQSLATSLLGSVTYFGITIFLIVVYAAFLMAERDTFSGKLAVAFPQGAERTIQLVTEINKRIGDYLAVKSLGNAILGVISFVILWAMGVDFALFWAVLIALFNYIPYVGGLIGVALPVVLSLAQFGSLTTTLILAALLGVAQAYVGSWLEPRLFGKQLNLSPFVILVALSFWSAIWGLPGAILAVPMTSMLAIVCAAFPETRFVAVLLSQRVDPRPDGPPA